MVISNEQNAPTAPPIEVQVSVLAQMLTERLSALAKKRGGKDERQILDKATRICEIVGTIN